MKDIQNWDRELVSLSNELNTYAKQIKEVSRDRFTRVYQEFEASRKLENSIRRKANYIARQTARSALLPKKDAAVLYWSRNFSDKARSYLDLINLAFSKLSWLRIIQSRVAGSKAETKAGSKAGLGPPDLREEQILLVATRKRDFVEAKDYWLTRIGELDSEISALQADYDRFQIEQENHEASLILSYRLGVDHEDAARGPMMQALETFVCGLTAPVSRAKAFEALCRRLNSYHSSVIGFLNASRAEAMHRLTPASDSQGTTSLKTPAGKGRFEPGKQASPLTANLAYERVKESQQLYHETQRRFLETEVANPTLKLVQKR